MDNSIYVTLSRQMAVFRKMDITANNLANANTTGFQSEQLIFTDYLVDEGNRKSDLSFTQDISSWRDTTDGPMRQTGNPFDVAITGPGYFQVETAGGTRYTRAGNFILGNDGTLMTANGYPVLSNDGQRIVLNQQDRKIMIGANGLITVADPQGNLQGRGEIGLVEVDDPQSMRRLNNMLLETDQPVRPATASSITQGALEQSNVSPISELIKVTKLSRSTSSTAKFIEIMYDLERKTSNAYARANNN